LLTICCSGELSFPERLPLPFFTAVQGAYVAQGKGGTPNVPGSWNEIAARAALSSGNTLDQNARLFAELNAALAGAVIGHLDAKYTFNR
jgi:hypothetical protein